MIDPHRIRVITDIKESGLVCYVPTCKCGWEGVGQILEQLARNEGQIHRSVAINAERIEREK